MQRAFIVTILLKSGSKITIRCKTFKYTKGDYEWIERPNWLYPTKILGGSLSTSEIEAVTYRKGGWILK